MANWQYRLDVREEWKQANRGELTAMQMGQTVARKLRELYMFPDGDLLDLIDQFDALDEQDEFDDFDVIWEELYDWADEDHRLWIATVLG